MRELRALAAAPTRAGAEILAAGLTAHELPAVPATATDTAADLAPHATRAGAGVIVVSAGVVEALAPEAAAETFARLPVPALVVGDHSDEQVDHAVRAGATGFVTWSQPMTAIVRAAHQVAAGEAVVPPGMLGGLLRRLIERGRDHDRALRRISRLTARERQVLALLVAGHGHEAISDVLVVTSQTARTHIQRVLTKLEVSSRVEAIALVRDHDLHDSLDPVPAEVRS